MQNDDKDRELKNKSQEKKQETRILSKINLKVNTGEFVAVVGKVGAGKSSLVYALMDEMVRLSG